MRMLATSLLELGQSWSGRTSIYLPGVWLVAIMPDFALAK
jgi:hypothetical protein